MNKPFKILTIDGGGIKGVFSAQVLAEFEDAFDTNVSDHFDLVCGTSTGGIIALGVTAQIPMKRIVAFYEEYGPAIFAQRWKKCLGNQLMALKQALFKSKYSERQLENALTEVFGNRLIGSSNNLLCIPAYNITEAMPRIFKRDYQHLNKDSNKRYVDVAMATSAAPTYFPIKEIENTQYVDGGLFANNPVLVGLTEAVFNEYWIKCKEKRKSDDYDGVEILSISSCEKPSGDFAKKTSRSFFDWRKTLFDACTKGQSNTTDFFLKQIVSHLDFELTVKRISNKPLSDIQAKKIEMDKADKSAIKLLKSIGTYTGNIEKNDEMVKKLFTEHKSVAL